MNKLFCYLSVCTLFFTSCKSVNQSEFYVELSHAPKGTPVLVYVSDASGIIEFTIPDTFFTDKKGKCYFDLEISRPKTILIKAETKNGIYSSTPLYITQGGEFNIEIALTGKGKDILIPLITGENNLGMVELIRFNNEKSLIDYNKLFDSTHYESLFTSYEEQINKSLVAINQLYKVKRIDEPYFEYATRYVEYYFALNTLQYIEQHIAKADTVKKKILEEQKSLIYKRAPINNPYLYQTSVAKDYIELLIPEIIKNDKIGYEESLKKSLGQTFMLSKIKQLIHKNAYQYYALAYLKTKSIRLDQETITLFSQYAKEYPENKNMLYFQEIQNNVIPEIKAFYSNSGGSLNPGITVLDDSVQVTCFKQAVSRFRGNYVFIDIWASWCPDCIKEFSYNLQLKSFLKANDIACLYISLERSPDRAKWKRYLNKYNLIGSHILINDLLKNDLYQVLGTTSLWIPRYILVDPNGNIVLSEGALPSDGTKLYDQIFSILSSEVQ
jgi:thiol-disulfide isomerase/thioredoxin